MTIARSFAARSYMGRRPLRDRMARYLNRLGGNPASLFVTVINQLVADGEDHGWIGDAPIVIYLNCVEQPGGCLINVVDGRWSTGSLIGSLHHIPYVGMTGDPATSAGISHDAIWQYIPGASPTNFWCAEFQFQDYASSGAPAYGWYNGGAQTAMRCRYGATMQAVGDGATFDSFSAPTSIGFNGIFRGSADSYIVRKSGTEFTISRAAATALPTGPLTVFKLGSAESGSSQAAMLCGTDPRIIASADLRAQMETDLTNAMAALGVIDPNDLIFSPDSITKPNAYGPSAQLAFTPRSLRIFRQAAAPAPGWTADTFNSAPITDVITPDVGRILASGTLLNAALEPVGVRSIQARAYGPAGIPPKISLPNGKTLGEEFSTYTKAFGATLAITSNMLGLDPHQSDGRGYLDYMNAAGMADSDFIDYAYAKANGSSLTTYPPSAASSTAYQVLRDQVVSTNGRLAPGMAANLHKVVAPDYEPDDQRPWQITTPFLLQWADLIHSVGAEAALLCDPFNASASAAGLSVNNLYQIHAAWDWLPIIVGPRPVEGNVFQALYNQLVLLTGPNGDQLIDYSKLLLQPQIGAQGQFLPLADAAVARQALLGQLPGLPPGKNGSTAFGGIYPSNFTGTPGGDPSRMYNQIIAILFGLTPGIYYP